MLNVLPATLYYSEIIVGLDETVARRLVARPRKLVTALHDLRRCAEEPRPLTAEGERILRRAVMSRSRRGGAGSGRGTPR